MGRTKQPIRPCENCGNSKTNYGRLCGACQKHDLARRQRAQGLTCTNCGFPPGAMPLSANHLCTLCFRSPNRIIHCKYCGEKFTPEHPRKGTTTWHEECKDTATAKALDAESLEPIEEIAKRNHDLALFIKARRKRLARQEAHLV